MVQGKDADLLSPQDDRDAINFHVYQAGILFLAAGHFVNDVPGEYRLCQGLGFFQ